MMHAGWGSVARAARAGGVLRRWYAAAAEQDLTRSDLGCPVASPSRHAYFAQCIPKMCWSPNWAVRIASLGHLKLLQSKSYTDKILGEGFSQIIWCESVGPQAFCGGYLSWASDAGAAPSL